MRRIAFIYCVLFLSLEGVGQTDYWQTWSSNFVNLHLSNKFFIQGDYQFRNIRESGIGQILLRNGLAVNVSDQSSILQGYALIINDPNVNNNGQKPNISRIIEHRLYQQFLLRQSSDYLLTIHRFRLEERFLEQDFKLRFRYFLNMNVPLNDIALNPNAIYLSVYDEIFLNLDENPLDRNRLYFGMGYVMSQKLRIEMGLMAQHRFGVNAEIDRNLVLSLFSNLRT
jgi:hypothetical protein